MDVPNGESGWKRHLLQGDGCAGNERKLRKKAKPEKKNGEVEKAMAPAAESSPTKTKTVTKKPVGEKPVSDKPLQKAVKVKAK
jgi:hypothetical protein